MFNGERLIDVPAIGWTLLVMSALLVLYFMWRMARMYYIEKRTTKRREFYEQYEAPKGQAAIENRKQIEADIEMDHDLQHLNRRQIRAVAVNIDFTMRKRASAAKAAMQ